MERIWKDITGYNGKYQVSNDGLVKSTVGNEKLLKVEETARGYYRVELCDCTGKRNRHKHFIHKLIYQAFVGDIPEDKEIDHILPIKNGGDPIALSNLRLVSHKDNMNNPRTLLNRSKETTIEKDGETITFNSQKDVANYLGVNKQRISYAIQNNTKVKGYSIKSKPKDENYFS
jgi:hypothetical protein